jgi:hypothetical protein
MIPQLIEDLLLLPPAVSRGSAAWLLAADCDLLLLHFQHLNLSPLRNISPVQKAH